MRPTPAGRCSRSTSLPRRCSPGAPYAPYAPAIELRVVRVADIRYALPVHGRLDGRELGRVQVIEAPSQATAPRGAAARQPGRGLDLPSQRLIRAGRATLRNVAQGPAGHQAPEPRQRPATAPARRRRGTRHRAQRGALQGALGLLQRRGTPGSGAAARGKGVRAQPCATLRKVEAAAPIPGESASRRPRGLGVAQELPPGGDYDAEAQHERARHAGRRRRTWRATTAAAAAPWTVGPRGTLGTPLSQRRRKLVEEVFGWLKTGGRTPQAALRGPGAQPLVAGVRRGSLQPRAHGQTRTRLGIGAVRPATAQEGAEAPGRPLEQTR